MLVVLVVVFYMCMYDGADASDVVCVRACVHVCGSF